MTSDDNIVHEIADNDGIDSQDSDEDGDEDVMPLSGGKIPLHVRPGRNRDGKQRVVKGFRAKPDNAVRYIKPGTVAGTKIGYVQKEVIGVVNAAIKKLPAPYQDKLWKIQTIKDKYKYIKRTSTRSASNLWARLAVGILSPSLWKKQSPKSPPTTRSYSLSSARSSPETTRLVAIHQSMVKLCLLLMSWTSRVKFLKNPNNKDQLFETSVINIMSEFSDTIKSNKASASSGSSSKRAAFDLEQQALEWM
ncbi:hypothetical protein BGZ95_011735 [Linnemannia exigua]|uniref:Uncharacterized protein n=1 Tax=Linnemannia exigua TaxID=604196 RepID=A0AAD4D9G8_9FUNG|nr:hypothetical protein BGZ95_011735 [Linnemannia exigua]